VHVDSAQGEKKSGQKSEQKTQKKAVKIPSVGSFELKARKQVLPKGSAWLTDREYADGVL
jgi:hypothetical protein